MTCYFQSWVLWVYLVIELLYNWLSIFWPSRIFSSMSDSHRNIALPAQELHKCEIFKELKMNSWYWLILDCIGLNLSLMYIVTIQCLTVHIKDKITKSIILKPSSLCTFLDFVVEICFENFDFYCSTTQSFAYT